MDRRTFLLTAGALSVVPVLPAVAAPLKDRYVRVFDSMGDPVWGASVSYAVADHERVTMIYEHNRPTQKMSANLIDERLGWNHPMRLREMRLGDTLEIEFAPNGYNWWVRRAGTTSPDFLHGGCCTKIEYSLT